MDKKFPGAILQARMGSTRLPGKMSMDFYRGKTIPELMVEEIARVIPRSNIILATTTSSSDDELVKMAEDMGIETHRGSEDDVLERFITAINSFDLEVVYRICTDNPFLRSEYLRTLLNDFDPKKHDYATFEFPDGTPIMKSHIGLFAEIMTADYLKELDRVTRDAIYREHVTNYTYEHRDEYRTLFLPVPPPVDQRQDVRLTIDTPGDLQMAKELYSELRTANEHFSVEQLLEAIDNDPSRLRSMSREIERNSK